MDRMGLMAQRGVEAKWTAFASGPAINEVLISGRYQAGNGGNFPCRATGIWQLCAFG